MTYRERLDQLCRIAPGDGPCVRELKANLSPPLHVPDFIPQPVDVAPGNQKGVVEPPNIALQRREPLLRCLWPQHTHGREGWPWAGARSDDTHHVFDVLLSGHRATISRLLSGVKRRLLQRTATCLCELADEGHKDHYFCCGDPSDCDGCVKFDPEIEQIAAEVGAWKYTDAEGNAAPSDEVLS